MPVFSAIMLRNLRDHLMAESASPLLPALKAIVGDTHVLTAAADVAPISPTGAVDITGKHARWYGPARLPKSPRSSAPAPNTALPSCRKAATPGLCGGATPHAEGEEMVVSLARLNRVRAIDVDNATMTVEAGVPLAGVQEAAAQAGLLFPLVACGRRQLPHRRQPLDQCRRHRRSALRQRARPGARPRSRARGRPRLGRPERSAQGQHRLRPQAAVPRQRRHARHHHRRGAEAVSRGRARRRRHGPRSPTSRPQSSCCARCARRWATA